MTLYCHLCRASFEAAFRTACERRLAEHLKNDHPSKGGSNGTER